MNNFPVKIQEAFSKLALSGKAVGDEPYIVGGFIRDWLSGLPIDDIKDLDIISRNGKTEEIIQDFVTRYGIGEPKEYEHTGTKTIFFKDFKLEFQSAFNENVHFPIEEEMKKMGIEVNFLNKNIYERDFTVNTICYDVINNKIIDLTGHGIDDLEKGILRTPINPEAAIFFNPIIILRGFRFQIEFNLKLDPEYEKHIKTGVQLLPKAVMDRDKRFINKIIRTTFDLNEKMADAIYRKYGIYDMIDIPKDIMDRKVKSDMGLKYLAKYDTIYTISKEDNKVSLALDFDEITNPTVFHNIKKLASYLYLNNEIDEKTQFKSITNDVDLFCLENIKEAFSNFENNKIVSYAQTGNFLYDRYKRRKEYRDRKRREEKRDRINKIKMWHDFQTKFVR